MKRVSLTFSPFEGNGVCQPRPFRRLFARLIHHFQKTLRCASPPPFVSLLLGLLVSWGAHSEEIHRERSLYRNIVVVNENGKLCMRFETRRRLALNQACIMTDDPEKLVSNYARLLLGSLFVKESPKTIAVIGLGGGVMPRVLKQLLPDAVITSVEIDPAVVKLAKKYFLYEEDNQTKTVVKDGRVFIKRAALSGEKYDWVILDAFNGDYIPEHLMTLEFLQEVKSVLKPGGIVSSNTFSSSKLYDYESQTYRSAFGDFYNLRPVGNNNRIVIACNCDINSTQTDLATNAAKWSDRFNHFGVNADTVLNLFTLKPDWDLDSPALTDQYSPANLLNDEPEMP